MTTHLYDPHLPSSEQWDGTPPSNLSLTSNKTITHIDRSLFSTWPPTGASSLKDHIWPIGYLSSSDIVVFAHLPLVRRRVQYDSSHRPIVRLIAFPATGPPDDAYELYDWSAGRFSPLSVQDFLTLVPSYPRTERAWLITQTPSTARARWATVVRLLLWAARRETGFVGKGTVLETVPEEGDEDEDEEKRRGRR